MPAAPTAIVIETHKNRQTTMRTLDDISLKIKLALVPALCMTLLLGLCAIMLWGTSRLGDALQSLYAERLPRYGFAARFESDLRDLNGMINQSIAFEAMGYGADIIAEVDKAIEATGARLEQEIGQRAQAAEPAERAQLEEIASSLRTYRKGLQDTLDLKSTGLATASTFLTTAQKQYATLIKSVSAISSHELEQAGADVAGASATSNQMKLAMGVAALVAVVLAAAFSVLLARGMLRRVSRLSQAMRDLAAGDLTQPIQHQGRDEIGRLVDDAETVRSRLSESMQAVQRASESVHAAASEIASGNADLGQRTESTSSALQQTASSMQQLSTAVNENAGSADRASSTASDAADAARAGGEVVSQVVQTMGEISTASRRIAEITGVIDGIAFQTNILALNAAVEAARAGEQGRGFAVVAGEVRNLAQRSAEAAKEISALIQTSAERVETGSRLVAQAGSSIDGLVTQVSNVAELVSGIRSATVQQSGEIAQINQALTALDGSTQQNAALVEQSSAAAESLRQQADRLAGTMQRFRVAA